MHGKFGCDVGTVLLSGNRLEFLHLGEIPAVIDNSLAGDRGREEGMGCL